MLPLRRASVQTGDHVNIIQHPGGGLKQISLFANVVVFVGGGRVQYLTDTLPGSSGSPVLNANWNVVALHHSGGWLIEPNTGSKTTYYRNEGIMIDRIIDGLAIEAVISALALGLLYPGHPTFVVLIGMSRSCQKRL
jgi:Trypsin-like peptidase domain